MRKVVQVELEDTILQSEITNNVDYLERFFSKFMTEKLASRIEVSISMISSTQSSFAFAKNKGLEGEIF